MLTGALWQREAGACSLLLCEREQEHRLRTFDLSQNVSVHATSTGGVLALAADTSQQRYLLTGCADSAVQLFDTQVCNSGSGHAPLQLEPLFTASHRTQPGSAHRYGVTSLSWYPVDPGLYLTGSADKTVKLWDTNMGQVALTHNAPDKVLGLAMSAVARSHCLVAVASLHPSAQLLDPLIGAATHVLGGHTRFAVWCVAWSATHEHQLYTGDASGKVVVWDVRRPGPLATLDQNQTQPPRVRGPMGTHSTPPVPNRRRRGGPGSAPEAASAHIGSITGLHVTRDGLHAVTAGRDSRVRLWEAQHLYHLLVHYADTPNSSSRPRQMGSTPDGRVLFNPCQDQVQVFHVSTGQLLNTLQGHSDSVNAAEYVAPTGQLYTAGADGAVLVWEPREQQEAEVGGDEEGHLPTHPNHPCTV